MPTTCHVASFVLYIRPQRLAAVKAVVMGWSEPEVTVEAQDPAGRLAVVIATENREGVTRFFDYLQDQEGVLSVALIYSEQVEEESLP